MQSEVPRKVTWCKDLAKGRAAVLGDYSIMILISFLKFQVYFCLFALVKIPDTNPGKDSCPCFAEKWSRTSRGTMDLKSQITCIAI